MLYREKIFVYFESQQPIVVTLIMEAIRSSKMSVPTRTTWRHIPVEGILHSNRRENQGSYFFVVVYLINFPVP
jgi:hypothetical protein